MAQIHHKIQRSFRVPSGLWVVLLGLLGLCFAAEASNSVRKPLDEGATIVIERGRSLLLECQLPRGEGRAPFLQRYLADPKAWTRFERDRTASIPYKELKPDVQRRVIEAIFPDDYADASGWWHSVTYEGAGGIESWWNLAEWLTGKGTNYRVLETMPENQSYKGTPRKGQRLLIPTSLLKEAFKAPGAPAGRPVAIRLEPVEDDEFLEVEPGVLRYGSDGKGDFGAYRMKKGEAIYTSVIVRFTEFREVVAVQEAAAEVLKRNGIVDPTRIHVDQEIRIPLDMLADRYQPEGSALRAAYEGASADARRLRGRRGGAKDLEGVVVILDAGHGGRDHGAHHGGLYEDEITYDIVLRIKALLESSTRARVYVTMRDLSHPEKIVEGRKFSHDTDEVVLTTPPYDPQDTSVSANLRWYVANDIYRKEVKRGVKPENMLFASIHCDALYYKLRGSMVYIPGAAHRLSSKALDGPAYVAFTKGGHRSVSTTADERRRDEAVSRVFAETLLKSLKSGKPPIAVHTNSDPIRNVIQRSRTERWLPAVLKHTLVPTKVLVETANLQNEEDRKCLADPVWRQAYAEAFVRAVHSHFGK